MVVSRKDYVDIYMYINIFILLRRDAKQTLYIHVSEISYTIISINVLTYATQCRSTGHLEIIERVVLKCFYYTCICSSGERRVNERTLPIVMVEVPARCFSGQLTLRVNMYSHRTRDMAQSVPN